VHFADAAFSVKTIPSPMCGRTCNRGSNRL
jgi:hypothetical protein